MLLKGENRVVLHVEDYEACCRFYGEGLELASYGGWDYGPEDRGLKYKNNGMDIEIIHRPPPVPQGATTLMFEAVDLDECYQMILGKPFMAERIIEHVATRPYGIRCFRMLDPNGNDIVIYDNWNKELRVPATFRVQILTDHFDEVCSFYGDKLAFPVNVQRDNGEDDRVCVFGAAKGEIEVIYSPSNNPHLNNNLLVQIEVKDVDDLYEKAIAQGIQIIQPLTDEFYGHRDFLIRDPIGTTLKMFSPLETKKL